MNLNKVFILGRLTADPVVRATPSGQSVASLALATNRVWNDKAGQKQEQVEFHNIVVWGKQAAVASKFLKKGGLALIEGRMQTRKWEGKDGQQRSTTEIVADRIQLGPRPMGAGAGRGSFDSAPVAETAKASDVPVIEVGGEEGEIKESDLQF